MPGMTDLRSEWADAIYLERHRRRWTQEEVGRLAGLDQTTISKAEDGRAKDKTYRTIARSLGIALRSES